MTYKLNARQLILDLLYASKKGSMSIKRILAAAELFDISGNSIRVTMSRLTQDEVISSTERGIYQLTSQKIDTNIVGLAKNPEMKINDHWNGCYILIYTGNLGRIDRSALSKRDRSLGYYGFKEIEQDLFIRPDNLNLSLTQLKAETVKFGLDPNAHVFRVDQVEDEQHIQNLWNIDELHQNYHATIQSIKEWYLQAEQLNIQHAAKTAFFLGKTSLFTLRSDPLLPSEWIDFNIRDQFESSVREFEHKGQILWQQYFESKAV